MLHIFFNLPTLANDAALYRKKVVFLFFDRILKNQLHRQSRQKRRGREFENLKQENWQNLSAHLSLCVGKVLQQILS